MRLVDDDGAERDFFFEVSKYSAFLWRSHLERHLAIYELYKKTQELPGSVAEFGVYNGSNSFAKASRGTPGPESLTRSTASWAQGFADHHTDLGERSSREGSDPCRDRAVTGE